jgi:hypothetical protein
MTLPGSNNKARHTNKTCKAYKKHTGKNEMYEVSEFVIESITSK